PSRACAALVRASAASMPVHHVVIDFIAVPPASEPPRAGARRGGPRILGIRSARYGRPRHRAAVTPPHRATYKRQRDRLTDEELMAAYAGGDRRSFAVLFRRWAPRIHGFFLRALGEPQAADDLLQITFLNIHRAGQSFRPLLSLRSWLFSIAAHALHDELR